MITCGSSIRKARTSSRKMARSSSVILFRSRAAAGCKRPKARPRARVIIVRARNMGLSPFLLGGTFRRKEHILCPLPRAGSCGQQADGPFGVNSCVVQPASEGVAFGSDERGHAALPGARIGHAEVAQHGSVAEVDGPRPFQRAKGGLCVACGQQRAPIACLQQPVIGAQPNGLTMRVGGGAELACFHQYLALEIIEKRVLGPQSDHLIHCPQRLARVGVAVLRHRLAQKRHIAVSAVTHAVQCPAWAALKGGQLALGPGKPIIRGGRIGGGVTISRRIGLDRAQPVAAERVRAHIGVLANL
mmetsp:Transcript_27427/g.50497  ORF Transcript_27427/g.50497 Transcript_27427/m.50497 type:complete len:302 (+) Transcript_27427:4505-5410(+)